jgi:hypothetical protein
MKYFILFFSSFIFIITYVITYYIHSRFFPVEVVFYSALIDVIVASRCSWFDFCQSAYPEKLQLFRDHSRFLPSGYYLVIRLLYLFRP